MRIGIDASCWLNRRGYGRYTRELVRTLVEIDRDNEYWLFLDAETARRSEDLPDGPHRVIVGTARPAAEAAAASGRRSARDLWAMRTALGRRSASLDLFYFPSVYTFFPLGRRPKVIVTVHDTIAERHPEMVFPTWRSRFFWSLKLRWALRQADVIATVSESARDDLVKTFGLRRNAVRVIPDAVHVAFRPVPRGEATERVLARYGLGGDAPLILYVGGLSPHKNLPTLIEAFTRLLRDGAPAGARLALVGDLTGDVFHSNQAALRRQVARLGVDGQVVFTGFVPDADLVYLYNVAGMLVLPSFAEGFGLPAAEAMACGTPVIASRVPALLEVVGEGGLFFDPRSPAELTARLREVLHNGERRARLGRAALQQARRFSWEQSARAALEAFAGAAAIP